MPSTPGDRTGQSPNDLPNDTTRDLEAMQLAVDASRRAAEAGNAPFGAALMSTEGKVVLVASNNANTAADCTGHAEMVLIRDAQAGLGQASLRGATVFASGEPCAMCAGALFWAGVGRIVFAASQGEINRVLGSNPAMIVESRTVLAGAQPAVQIDGPLLADEAIAVLKKFAEAH